MVLKDIDVGVLAVYFVGYGLYNGHAFEIVPSPNPLNEGKLIYPVKRSNEPQYIVASIPYKVFPVLLGDNSEREFLDLLEGECRPVAVSERLEFRHRMNSFRCPFFDCSKKSLMRYLAR